LIVRYVNDAFCRISGRLRAALTGRPLPFPAVRDLATVGGPAQGEVRLDRPDGAGYWAEVNLLPVAGAGGRPGHLVLILRDVTDRKQAEDGYRAGEERIRAIGDNLPDGAIYQVTAPPGGPPRFTHASAGVEVLLGVPAGEVLADPELLYRMMHPDDLPGFRAAELASFQALRPFEYEFRSLTRHAGVRWLHLRSRPTPRPGGGSVWNGLVLDVTERRRAEDALRRSESLFRGIFQSATAGVSLTGPTGRFVAANPAFVALTGRTLDDLLALTPADITHPDDWAAQAPLMAELTAGGRDRLELTKRYVRPDGSTVWAEVTVSAVHGTGGGYEYGLGVSIDVTARRRLEEQYRQSRQVEAVGHLAGGVAHDFNNLLTVITGNLALARLPAGDPNRPLLAAAEQAAARAADLTRKLLGYARRNQMAAGPVDPADVLSAVAAAVAWGADPRVRVRVEVAPRCGPVLADPGLLHQALLNLGMNARDAMPAGGTVTFSAEPVAAPRERGPDDPPDAPATEPLIRFGVTDTGVGMTDAVRDRVFDPFFTTKEVGKGTGLGLPMVRGIIEQHRGWVELSTAPGAGTRFDVYLPAAPPTLLVTPPPVRQTPPCNRAPATRPDGGAATILLVDDEAMIRDLGRAVLERAGYRVLTADDGVDGVETFAARRADIALVVLDVTMPRMSGRDAFRHILHLDPAARVLFSTGYSADDIASLDGAVGLLNKPYRPGDLLAAVRAALADDPAAP
ncbi:MAG TPA: PAS domain S-box protein, partial [Urbifossiella sp.]|nr:PAS domain S-box protein [Urbifossiella sp.]